MKTIFDTTKFKATYGKHRNKKVIWVSFPKDKTLIGQFKTLSGAKWSNTEKKWYLSDVKAYRELFNLPNETLKVPLNIHPNNHPAYIAFLETLQLKAFSPNTIKTYTNEFAIFLQILKSHKAADILQQKLRSYFLYCVNELKLSENTIHSRLNALKFYYEKVLKRENFFFEIPRPNKPNTLPKVLSAKQVARIINLTQNLKHKLILQLAYGMGLRVSEIINLKVSDINSQRMQVLIEGAKGKKDRYVNLPDSILEELRSYYKHYLPKIYLFEGQYGGQYSTRSAQFVFKQALKRAKIKIPIGIHGLRHSYATHLMEYGIDTTFIQKLLGHSNIKTTQIYTRVSKRVIKKVKSPLDYL